MDVVVMADAVAMADVEALVCDAGVEDLVVEAAMVCAQTLARDARNAGHYNNNDDGDGDNTGDNGDGDTCPVHLPC